MILIDTNRHRLLPNLIASANNLTHKGSRQKGEIMTVASLKEVIEEMRTVYPFTDDKARIYTDYDARSGERNAVTIKAIDERTGTFVVLSNNAEGDIEK